MRTGGLVGDVDVERRGFAGTDLAGLPCLQLAHPRPWPGGGRGEEVGGAAREVALVRVLPPGEVGQAGLELLHLVGSRERNSPGFSLFLLSFQLGIRIQILESRVSSGLRNIS